MNFTFETEQSLELIRLACFRKKMKPSSIQQELEVFLRHLRDQGLQKAGPMVSATFAVEPALDEPILDMEFLIPVDRPVELNGEYMYKPLFRLVHAVRTRFSGNPAQLEAVYQALQQFLNSQRLQPISAVYNVTLNNEAIVRGEILIIDIYVSVNPNVV